MLHDLTKRHRATTLSFVSLAALAVASGAVAEETALTPPEITAQAKKILKTSIGYRTVEGAGQTHAYADYLAGVLKKGGFADADIDIEDIDGTSTLTAIYHGEGAGKPILLSGHMDVVEAKREDWERDPFTAVEENGYIYGRGATDMKFGIAMMATTLVRLKQEGFKPKQDIILVLSGDEETQMATTAVLADKYADAELVLNADGGGGALSEDGEPIAYYVQGAEKTYADFQIEFTNPGGHSSMPRKDNAIYDLAKAADRIAAYEFPVQWSDITLGFFRETGPRTPGPVGEAMVRFAKNPRDKGAIKILKAQPEYVGQLGTTCVATMIEGGHALNALPQRADLSVNCRIFPGVSPDSVQETLAKIVDNPQAKISLIDEVHWSDASPLREDVMAATRKAIERRFPGGDIPVVPQMSAGASDSLYFRAHGVDSYGVSGLFMKASDEYSHGLNERSPVDSIDGALDHWHVLLTELAG